MPVTAADVRHQAIHRVILGEKDLNWLARVLERNAAVTTERDRLLALDLDQPDVARIPANAAVIFPLFADAGSWGVYHRRGAPFRVTEEMDSFLGGLVSTPEKWSAEELAKYAADQEPGSPVWEMRPDGYAFERADL
jgi:hypothetical protein